MPCIAAAQHDQYWSLKLVGNEAPDVVLQKAPAPFVTVQSHPLEQAEPTLTLHPAWLKVKH